MTTNRYEYYEDENNENQNYSEQYKDPFDERFLFEENQLGENDFLKATDKNIDDDFDFEQNTPDDLDDDIEDLDPNDMDDDLIERYDENDRDPETFSDDAYKID